MSTDYSRENRKLFEEIRLLPIHDLDPDHSRRIITSALVILQARKGHDVEWLADLARLYTGFLEPLWVAAFSAAFLVWAVRCAAPLLH